MMAYSEDQIALAAEYALGTLDADERVQVEVLMFSDPEFSVVVEAWARKLGNLNDMVGSVEPSGVVWARIRAAIKQELQHEQAAGKIDIGRSDFGASDIRDAAGAQLVAGSGSETEPAADDVSAAVAASSDPAAPEGAAADISAFGLPDRGASIGGDNVVAWTGRVQRWRSVATAMTAIAAGLACVVALQAVRPDLLPATLRVPAKDTTAAKMPAQYVALLQTDSNSPAFILTVDAGAKTFMVRKVGATLPAGKSYELWLVSDKLPAPKSLGLIGDHDFTLGPKMRGDDNDMMMKATYAVTVEPEGGAPGGVATGPIVFTGKLIETVPSDMPPAPAPAAPK